MGPARLKEFVQNGLVYPHAPAISAIATNAGGLCREALHDMDELMRLEMISKILRVRAFQLDLAKVVGNPLELIILPDRRHFRTAASQRGKL